MILLAGKIMVPAFKKQKKYKIYYILTYSLKDMDIFPKLLYKNRYTF